MQMKNRYLVLLLLEDLREHVVSRGQLLPGRVALLLFMRAIGAFLAMRLSTSSSGGNVAGGRGGWSM